MEDRPPWSVRPEEYKLESTGWKRKGLYWYHKNMPSLCDEKDALMHQKIWEQIKGARLNYKSHMDFVSRNERAYGLMGSKPDKKISSLERLENHTWYRIYHRIMVLPFKLFWISVKNLKW